MTQKIEDLLDKRKILLQHNSFHNNYITNKIVGHLKIVQDSKIHSKNCNWNTENYGITLL